MADDVRDDFNIRAGALGASFFFGVTLVPKCFSSIALAVGIDDIVRDLRSGGGRGAARFLFRGGGWIPLDAGDVEAAGENMLDIDIDLWTTAGTGRLTSEEEPEFGR